ncbi:flagellar protein FlaG [Paenibacillus sp. KQZ6P-2]|uniref:Flagellar protein FlaG n=1 Tax=Paenibacillus mangrovi TaxID=2931978 RepID=A0A9X2B3A2_9BACL|nr:flagellar protein FlaG [Paenibacillus mangrovi]MCJ8012750.1 flagellar protein FlaG [Paenibacillus mangrovi]
MEVQSKIHQVQSQIKEQPINLAAGEYSVLKEKSKGQILSVSEKALVNAIEKANKAAEGSQHEFNFKVHEATGDIIVQVVTRDTHEVIKEIPSEKLIDLVEKLKELTVGAIIDEKR